MASTITTKSTNGNQSAKQTSRKANGTEATKVAGTTKTVKPEEVVGYEDTIEVRKADGTIAKLGDLPADGDDATPTTVKGKVGVKPPKASAAKTQAVPKPGQSKSAKVVADKTVEKALSKAELITQKALENAAKIKQDAKDKAAKIKQETKDKAAKLKQEAKDKAAAEREAKKQQKIDEREAKKAERAAAKLRQRGETGDAEVDAAFHAAQDEARAIAVVPADPKAISLDFLKIPGVRLSPVGLTLPPNLPIGEWVQIVRSLSAVGDVSQFAIGDALEYGGVKYAKQYDVLIEALSLDRSTLKNYKYVAGAFKETERVPGASFTHHLEAAGLKGTNPAAARNILQEAVRDRRPASWVRQQVNELKPEQPSKLAKRQAEIEALVLVADEQREADLKALGSPEAIAKAVRVDLNALIEYCQYNDVVPSATVLRNVARLEAIIEDLTAERDALRQKYEGVTVVLNSRQEANARILEADEDLTGLADEDGLAFLNELGEVPMLDDDALPLVDEGEDQ